MTEATKDTDPFFGIPNSFWEQATKETDPFFGIPNSFWEQATKEHCKDKDDPFYKSLLKELEGEKGEKVILKEKD